MPRVNATFKPTIFKISKAYSIFHQISFSESIEILATSAGLEWWNKLTKKQKADLDEKVLKSKKS